MTAQIKPAGLLSQTALLLALGALFGFGARAVTDADFSLVVDGPKQADVTRIDALLNPTQTPTTAAQPLPSTMVEPEKVDFVTVMSKMFGQPKVTIIDARDAGMYENGHIQGALHLDGDKLAQDPNTGRDTLDDIPKDNMIMVYCSGGDCDLSLRVGRILLSRGFSHVFVYEGGFNEWQKETGPISRGLDP